MAPFRNPHDLPLCVSTHRWLIRCRLSHGQPGRLGVDAAKPGMIVCWPTFTNSTTIYLGTMGKSKDEFRIGMDTGWDGQYATPAFNGKVFWVLSDDPARTDRAVALSRLQLWQEKRRVMELKEWGFAGDVELDLSIPGHNEFPGALQKAYGLARGGKHGEMARDGLERAVIWGRQLHPGHGVVGSKGRKRPFASIQARFEARCRHASSIWTWSGNFELRLGRFRPNPGMHCVVLRVLFVRRRTSLDCLKPDDSTRSGR